MSIASGLTPTQLANSKAIVATVRARGLPLRAAVCTLECAMVESGIRVYANYNIAESFNYPHEAVGSDHASVGIEQQQVPSWGSTHDCMDPVQSALKFLYGAGDNPGLLTLPNYRFSYVGYSNASRYDQIPTGSAVQAVQVSAYPDRYQQMEPQATALAQELWTAAPSPTAPSTEDDDMSFELIQHDPDGIFAWNAAGAWWHVPTMPWVYVALNSPACTPKRVRPVGTAEFDVLKSVSASAR
ncbi:MAG: hypothetical protein M3O41_09350 [Pseudomonadota bacterium]|nr:hypothetical protein [Pseudomonadota bacterium]